MRAGLRDKPVWLIALWLLGLIVLFKPWVHGTDPVGYYSWLRSAVIDGNLDTANEYVYYGEDKNDIIFPGPTGYNKNPYAVGSAILWSPFFLLAHLASAILGLPRDGYAPLYVLAASLGSAIYALIGLWLAYRIGRELFGARAAAWATAGVWWSTPLLFYMYSHPIMSHANDAFVSALFIYVWRRTRPGRSARGWLLLGGVLGLAMLVRAQNATLAALPLVEALFTWLSAHRIDVRRWLAPGILFGAAAAVAFAPQMIAWQQTYGEFLPGNPYAVYNDTFRFDFTSPNFFNVLLSSDRGLFVWSPLTAFAIVGLLALVPRADRLLGAGLALAFLAQVYLVGSWRYWSGAVAFGQRFMINSTAVFVVGLAALLAWLERRVRWRWIGATIVAFVAWNLLLLAQYIVELIPRASPVDVGQLVTNQFRVVGIVIERLGSLIADRFLKVR